jgi:hypothetical protein
LNILLALHNLNRWVVVVLIVAALVRAYSGWLQKKAWVDMDRRVSLFTTIALDVQVLLGLILYIGHWLPLLSDMGAVMSTPLIRLFAVEHPLLGLLTVIVAHIGSSRAKKAVDDAGKHKAIAIFFSIATLLLLILIPWGRPLLRGL